MADKSVEFGFLSKLSIWVWIDFYYCVDGCLVWRAGSSGEWPCGPLLTTSVGVLACSLAFFVDVYSIYC